MSKEILESHLGGPVAIKKIIENYANCNETDTTVVKKLAEEADERFTTYAYSENCDQHKYGLVLKGLNSQKSLKMISFPRP